MSGTEIGLAASARDWSDRLHRFVLDHGGATVRGRVMTAEQALAGEYRVLLIDDVCSFLTPRLVQELRGAGKSVVGVFDPRDGSDAKRRLLEVGISDVIESDATAEEFLALCASTARLHPSQPAGDPHRGNGLKIAVLGPPGGVGVTEVACALAVDLARRRDAVLVDGKQEWPSVGQRLDLDVYPNVMTAVDFMHHEPHRIRESCQQFDGSLSVVAGRAGSATSPAPSELSMLVRVLAAEFDRVIIDAGSTVHVDLIRSVDVLLLVGLGSPVGVTRLLRMVRELIEPGYDGPELAIVVNRVSETSGHKSEITRLIRESVGDLPIVFLPEDKRITSASWDGVAVGRGPFHRKLRRLSRLFDGVADDH